MDKPKSRGKAFSLDVKLVMRRARCDGATAISLLNRHNGNAQAACDDHIGSWDFILPKVPAPSPLASALPPLTRRGLDMDDTSDPFSGDPYDDFGFLLGDLIGAIQHGESCTVVRAFLTHFNERLGSNALRNRLNDPLNGCPGIFFVVDTGNVEMLKVWTSYAGNAEHTYREVPILGFAIARCQDFRQDMPLVVKTMLSMGWSVGVIPRAFYEPLDRDLPDEGPSKEELDDLDDKAKAWCVAPMRRRVAQSLNFSFTVRYVLHIALRGKQLSGAIKQLAQVHKASELLGIGYFLVGQTLASGLLTDRFLSYLAMPIRQPLVLLFAGPSGHGKTELARNLGRMLSLDLHGVDCTNLRHESDLFGPWFPFAGSDKGSAVNNYLAAYAGKRCIVFMDEFEKTTDEVRHALLVPFQSGEYRNRTNNTMVDCSKTIWVLATNAFDQIIHSFYDSRQEELVGDRGSRHGQDNVRRLGKQLSGLIRKQSISVFGAPVTGRITEFIPFLPFSPVEQAAVADLGLAELGRELARPINSVEDPACYRSVGDLDLEVKRAHSICKALAEQGYVPELGARSIINTIDREIRMPLVWEYLATREGVQEGQPAASFVVGVDAESGEVEVSECAI
ncbi:P-loop containing nucleoside triphosphate hydrolase protein [Parathielavia hyrcaniae]|uniref:P-loop containing nucleoside triphosphate hydrolase protein n=1 Tax=Parathielavia hyrcaniae TaxID=113614 RepID=A0AAN6T064_9PEZI|nr:P-loop containing nucleoside triphosphate hydrolase protein [Parathielavia hyrcaniae]